MLRKSPFGDKRSNYLYAIFKSPTEKTWAKKLENALKLNIANLDSLFLTDDPVLSAVWKEEIGEIANKEEYKNRFIQKSTQLGINLEQLDEAILFFVEHIASTYVDKEAPDVTAADNEESSSVTSSIPSLYEEHIADLGIFVNQYFDRFKQSENAEVEKKRKRKVKKKKTPIKKANPRKRIRTPIKILIRKRTKIRAP